jgi:hypothetical protein
MFDLHFGRHALGVCVATAMLAGCGGRAGGGVVPNRSGAANSFPYHETFHYTGEGQNFTVPGGVTQIKVIALGAHGSSGSMYLEYYGLGGRVSAEIPVTPGETLVVYVGGNASATEGGFNGGANGGTDSCCGDGDAGGGGGASDVRVGGTALSDRILVAGGGGGEGGFGGNSDYPGGEGGKGGGLRGGAGSEGESACNGAGGDGGTQTAGGTGGAPSDCHWNGGSGASGTFGAGGRGGNGGNRSAGQYGGAGGGGGGGYYGGGGGGGGGGTNSIIGAGGGGGGGSSYVESSATDVHMWQGWKHSAHNGLVVFSW